MRAIASLCFLFAVTVSQVSLVAAADEVEPEQTATSDGSVATSDTQVVDESPVLDELTPTESPDEGTVTESTETPTAETLDDATAETSGSQDASISVDSSTRDGSTTSEPQTVEAINPGPPSGDGVQPIGVAGNPTCLNVMSASDFSFEQKQDPPQDATIALSHDGLTGTLTISVNEEAQTVDFSFTGDFVAAGVIVKAGSDADFYDYRPDGNASDTGLHGPVNPMNGKFFGLSHLSFCIAEASHEASIEVTKTCPDTAVVGAEIDYTIVIHNNGSDALVDLKVEDTLLGDITGDFDADLSLGLAVGATATAHVSRTPGPNEDPVTNTVTAEGTGADSDVTVMASDTCETDVVTPTGPAIQVLKGGPVLVHRGDTVTYQFEVTNLGNVELFDVELSDPRCDAGTIQAGADVDASLATGEVWHFTCTHLVTNADPNPILNTVTVRGDTVAGAGGEEVTDTASHEVGIITPAISIVKTVSDETVPVGTTVTYTYVVTNTGDTTLFDVAVNDDVLGVVGVIAVLEANASETLTATFTVGTEPVTNIGTASGEDVLGTTVTASDTATVTPIAGGGGNGGGPGGTPGGPGPGGVVGGVGGGVGAGSGGTPFTGSEMLIWALGAASLALVGLITLAATRKRRPQGSVG
jgi:hypothetical protein